MVFCPLLKKSSGNPYLKILDFSQIFIADAPMKKKIQKFSFTPAQSTFGTPMDERVKNSYNPGLIYINPAYTRALSLSRL